jgi:hypothetical protein
VVTIDTPVSGPRERDFRDGVKELLSFRPFTMLPFVGQILVRPRWLAAFLADGGLMNFPNIVLPGGPMPYADVAAALDMPIGSIGPTRARCLGKLRTLALASGALGPDDVVDVRDAALSGGDA